MRAPVHSPDPRDDPPDFRSNPSRIQNSPDTKLVSILPNRPHDSLSCGDPSPLTLLPELQVIRERSITLLNKSTNPRAVLDRFKNGIKRSFEGLLDPESHLRVFQVAEKMADAVETVVDSGNVKLPDISSSVSLPISMPLGCSNLCPMAAENSIKAEVMVLADPASKESNPVAAAGQSCGSKDFARNKAVHRRLQRPLLDIDYRMPCCWVRFQDELEKLSQYGSRTV